MRALTLSCFLVLAIGCGGADDSSTTTVTDTGTIKTDSTTGDTKSDTGKADTGTAGETTVTDAPAGEDTKGIVCGDKVCGDGETCCVSGNPDSGFVLACVKGSACPDGGAALKCDGPEDCPTGAKICCAEVDVEGTGLACTFSSGIAECRGTCDSVLPMMCPGRATVRRCHAKADCTESGFAKCCLFESGGTSAEFCSSDLVALAAKSCK